MIDTPRTVEEAAVEWKFAKEEARQLRGIALRANLADFAAQELVDELEDYLVEHAPGQTFLLGDGTAITVREVGRKGLKLIVNTVVPNPQNNEPNNAIPHHV